MISTDCRIADFLGAIRDKDYYEAVRLADLEATAAERLVLRSKADRVPLRCGREYAQTIKHLITYMRYGVLPPKQDGLKADVLRLIPTAGSPRASGVSSNHLLIRT
jgi:hypothetical protein